MKKATFIISALMLTLAATQQADAQQAPALKAKIAKQQQMVGKPAPQRGDISPEKVAERTAMFLSERLDLSQKQYKKVYKVYLDRANKVTQTAQSSDVRPGVAKHNGPEMGGGRRGGEAMRGGGPGTSGERMRDAGRQGGRTEMRPAMPAESDKDIASRDKKMKKILDSGQYAKWSKIEKEMIRRQARRQPGTRQSMEMVEIVLPASRGNAPDWLMEIPLVGMEVIDETIPTISR